MVIGYWILRFICNLGFEFWNFGPITQTSSDQFDLSISIKKHSLHPFHPNFQQCQIILEGFFHRGPTALDFRQGIEQHEGQKTGLRAAGLIGFGLKRYGFSPAPIIMGLVLGGLVETSLAQSMIIFDQQWTGFLARPISLIFFALALVSMLNAPVRGFIKNRLQRSGSAA